jgi:hypothetical protein
MYALATSSRESPRLAFLALLDEIISLPEENEENRLRME